VRSQAERPSVTTRTTSQLALLDKAGLICGECSPRDNVVMLSHEHKGFVRLLDTSQEPAGQTVQRLKVTTPPDRPCRPPSGGGHSTSPGGAVVRVPPPRNVFLPLAAGDGSMACDRNTISPAHLPERQETANRRSPGESSPRRGSLRAAARVDGGRVEELLSGLLVDVLGRDAVVVQLNALG